MATKTKQTKKSKKSTMTKQTNKAVARLSTSALEPLTFRVSGMTCSSCVSSIERTLNRLPRVKASVNFASETVHVLAPADMNPKVIISAIKSAGYTASSLNDTRQAALNNKKSATAFIFAAIFTIPLLAISMTMAWHPSIDAWINSSLANFNLGSPTYSPTNWLVIALSAPVVLIVAWPIHRAAIRNLSHPTMDTLISLGSLSAFGWSIYSNITGVGDVYAEAASTVILFVILGRYLETRAKKRASSALASLLALSSKEVSVVRNGEVSLISIDDLQVGDNFLAKPGQRIATDGEVVSGESSVDNSLLTGESRPIEVAVGSAVIGSSLNRNGQLVIRATRVGSDTELARITSMVVTAQGTKAPIQRMADRISAVFVPIVAAISVGTLFYQHYSGATLTKSITCAIAVLVIACPCALGLATPVALLVASGRGAQRGIVIREPRVLEVARKIDSVVLDKTGTLTDGQMTLIRALVVPQAGSLLGAPFTSLLNEAVIFSSALSIEKNDDHPIAISIAQFISSKGIKPTTVTGFAQSPGSGSAGRVNLGMVSPVVLVGSPEAVAHSTIPFHQEILDAISRARGEGLTASVLSWDGVALAVFVVGDQVKPDARKTITALKKRGIDPWLVTGDSVEVAQAVAHRVGIAQNHVVASALPETKVAHVKWLQKKGHRVLMVGDGINDAAALATSDLSIAMGTGTDTAMATADIVVMKRELSSVIDALKLSKKTLKVIRMNLVWALLYNVIGIPIAAMGGLKPTYAAAAMALSSLFVVTNSLRIK